MTPPSATVFGTPGRRPAAPDPDDARNDVEPAAADLLTSSSELPPVEDHLAWALRCAAHGWPVFPLKPNDKVPLTGHGFKDASRDEAVIRAWWTKTPTANIGVPTGQRFDVLDVDPRHDGMKSLAALGEVTGVDFRALLHQTPVAKTGSGGWHFLFAPHPGIKSKAQAFGPEYSGLDVKAAGGYIVAAPSVHPSGPRYLWAHRNPFTLPLAPWPESVLALMSPLEATAPRSDDAWEALLLGASKGERYDVATRIVGHYLSLRRSVVEIKVLLDGYAHRCVPPMGAPERQQLHAMVESIAAAHVVEQQARQQAKQAEREARTTRVRAAIKGGPRRAPTQEEESEHEARVWEATAQYRGGHGDAPEPELVTRNLGRDVVAEPVEWLWHGWLAKKKLAIIAGDPGLCKSTVTLDLAARITTGRPWPDGSGPAPMGHVIVLNCEDDAGDTIKPRILALGGNPDLVTIVDSVRTRAKDSPTMRERMVNFQTDLRLIQAKVMETGALYLTTDPLNAYMGKIRSFEDPEVRGVLGPLALIASELRFAVHAVMHLNKDTSKAPLHRLLGSVAYGASARLVGMVAPDPEEAGRILLFCLKASNADPDAIKPRAFHKVGDGMDFRIVWERDPVLEEVSLGDILSHSKPKEAGALDEAMAFLEEAFKAGQPIASVKIMRDAKDNGIKRGTLFTAKAKLGVKARKSHEADGGWLWCPPEHPDVTFVEHRAREGEAPIPRRAREDF